MAYRRRIFYTEEQKSEISDRWQRGESMSSIGRLFDRDSSLIYPLLSLTGGIRPPRRKRSRLALERQVSDELGLKINIKSSKGSPESGSLVIHYTNLDQLDDVLAKFTGGHQ